MDQALAWYRLANNGAGGEGKVSSLAQDNVESVIRRIGLADFSARKEHWQGDEFIAPVFAGEEYRRGRGGASGFAKGEDWQNRGKWYEEKTYYLGSGGEDVAAANWDGQELVIGVLLPLSGKYALHANRVKQGIELAWEVSSRRERIRLVFADTAGLPATAVEQYEKLATQSEVDFVLGPLLSKTSAIVAEASRDIGTPLLSFTKQIGIPEISSNAFRLGAISKDQVFELVNYSIDVLGLNNFACLYPSNSIGMEFIEAFRQEVQAKGGSVVALAAYVAGDGESMIEAVNQLAVSNPQAVFIPDQITGILPALETIQSSDLAGAILLGPAQWDDPVAIRGFGQLLESAIYVSPFFSLSQRPSVQEFLVHYRKKYKSEPELLSAQAYDAFALVVSKASAVQRGESASSLAEFMHAPKNYGGVTGRLQVSRDGEISRRMSVLRLRSGEVVEVMSAGRRSQGSQVYGNNFGASN